MQSELIEVQINELLKEIKDVEARKRIHIFFSKDVLEYIGEVTKIAGGDKKSRELEEKLAKLSNAIVLKGYALEVVVANKIIMQRIRDNFRHLVGMWAYKSPMIKRAFDKPKGYPGDYLMLENIYDNQPLAKDGIGFYFDRYFLNSSYAVAVRYRKDRLREILKTEIQKSKAETIKIFDIACGSCREIKELPHDLFKDKTAVFTCLDWDEDALDFSQKALQKFPQNAKFNFVKEDIMKLIKDSKLTSSFEKQDLVYSIGLIDYLPDRILKLFMKFFYTITKNKGKLILTHKNREKTFSPIGPDWFCNWKFVPRSKEEVTQLFYNSGLEKFSLSSEVDEFNDIFYFTLTKLEG